jgi:hypothetical protein
VSPTIPDRDRRPPRDVRTTLRQGIEGIALVAGYAGIAAILGWAIALVVSWGY